VVDGTNGAASVIIRPLCQRLGVELIPISCDPASRFPHTPDPTIDNLAAAAAIVPPVRASAGFGLSADCERVALVTELGRALGREATLSLVADYLLSSPRRPKGTPIVVVGANCDSRIFRVAERQGATVARCGVGVLAVAERTLLEDATVGGDNSGGVLVPSLHSALDGLANMALLLEAIATKGSAQALADRLPEVHLRTTTVPSPMSRAYSAVNIIRGRARGRVSDLDGVLVELDHGWYHVRVSHTEPLIRITCEAETDDACREMIAQIKNELRQETGNR
jgi:phosphomannomutase